MRDRRAGFPVYSGMVGAHPMEARDAQMEPMGAREGR